MKVGKKNIHPMVMVLAGLATVGLVYGAYVLIKRRKEGTDLPFISGGSSSSLCQHTNFPVRYGSCGEYVKPLQCHLNSQGANLDVDGKFGSKTKQAAQSILGKTEFDRAFMSSINHKWDSKNGKCK